MTPASGEYGDLLSRGAVIEGHGAVAIRLHLGEEAPKEKP
jgi:hypothetical protein